MNGLSWLMIAWALALTSPSIRPLMLPGGTTVFAAALSVDYAAPVGERLEAVTGPLLGVGYQASPLGEGEGEGPDDDPRLRFDAFDCTTFVETAMALALCPDPARLPGQLDRIRYRQEPPSFLARRHFPEAEWLPELEALGILRDVTGEVGGEATAVIERPAWPERAARLRQDEHALPLVPDARLPRGRVSLSVWPLESARRSLDRLPHGAVISLVRRPRPDRAVLVTHQGLVLARGAERVLRHASERPYGRVVDEPLPAFLARVASWKHWPALGLNVAVVEGAGCR